MPAANEPAWAVRAVWAAALALVGILAALVPPMADDFLQAGGGCLLPEIMAGAAPESLPEGTIADFWERPAAMYRLWDGRLAAYVAITAAARMPGIPYALLSVLLFGLTLRLFLRHAFGDDVSEIHVLLGAVSLLLFLPSPASLWFWRTAAGYAIGLVLFLWLLLQFRRNEISPAAVPAALAFSLLEYGNPVLLLPAGALCTLAAWRRGLPVGRHILVLACIAAGCAVVLSAPGNMERMRVVEAWFMDVPLSDRILAHLRRQKDLQLMLSPAWIMLLIGAWRRTPAREALLLFLLGQCGQAMYALAPDPAVRVYNAPALCALMGGAAAVSPLLRRSGPDLMRRFRLPVLAVLLAISCAEVRNMALCHADVAARGASTEVGRPRWRADAICSLGMHVTDISGDPSYWTNRVVAAHHRLPEIRMTGEDGDWEIPGAGLLSVHGSRRILRLEPDSGIREAWYWGPPALLWRIPFGDRLKDLLTADTPMPLMMLLYARADVSDGIVEFGNLRRGGNAILLVDDRGRRFFSDAGMPPEDGQ